MGDMQTWCLVICDTLGRYGSYILYPLGDNDVSGDGAGRNSFPPWSCGCNCPPPESPWDSGQHDMIHPLGSLCQQVYTPVLELSWGRGSFNQSKSLIEQRWLDEAAKLEGEPGWITSGSLVKILTFPLFSFVRQKQHQSPPSQNVSIKVKQGEICEKILYTANGIVDGCGIYIFNCDGYLFFILCAQHRLRLRNREDWEEGSLQGETLFSLGHALSQVVDEGGAEMQGRMKVRWHCRALLSLCRGMRKKRHLCGGMHVEPRVVPRPVPCLTNRKQKDTCGWRKPSTTGDARGKVASYNPLEAKIKVFFLEGMWGMRPWARKAFWFSKKRVAVTFQRAACAVWGAAGDGVVMDMGLPVPWDSATRHIHKRLAIN